jgi:hypothetical protein
VFTFLKNALDNASSELRAKFSAICSLLLAVNGAIFGLNFRWQRLDRPLAEPSAAP